MATTTSVDDVARPYDEPPTPPRKRRSGAFKALTVLGVCVLVLLTATVSTVLVVQHHLSGQVDRISGAFDDLQSRPARSTGDAAGAVNILLLGTDRRSDQPTTGSAAKAASWIPGEQRTDTMMVLHIDSDRKGASIISIPRDSWVDVPGYGSSKINAAFSYDGPSLAVQTVEQLTGVHIDHLAVIDWDGFKTLTDQLGGVDVYVPQTVHDSARDKTWTQGAHHLDGEQALLYVGQRHGLPGGDFDRIDRQQAFLRSVMSGTLHELGSGNPVTAYRLLDTLTQNLSVDDAWTTGDMRGLLLSLRGLRTSDVDFMTVPLKGTGYEGDQSVVYLDKSRGAGLWGSVVSDDVSRWLAKNPSWKLPQQVN